jgi:hypothetical protein
LITVLFVDFSPLFRSRTKNFVAILFFTQISNASVKLKFSKETLLFEQIQNPLPPALISLFVRKVNGRGVASQVQVNITLVKQCIYFLKILHNSHC